MALRPLRAPRKDGSVVAEPPLAEASRLLERNRHTLAMHGPDLLGRPWREIRLQARRTALALAREYLTGAGEPLPSGEDLPIIMAGHQPELFHPGVWVKNFALNGLARAWGGLGVNLVVDNDILKVVGIRVPVGPRDSPHLAAIPFDRWTAEVPYEERTVIDEDLFATFAERARQDWPFRPLLDEFWPEVRRQARRTPVLGERVAAARRTLERHWGCHNLELPVSRLCQTEPFAWFVSHLLHDLPRLHTVYNDCVHDYRRRHGLRSRNHPVPDLTAEDDWLEAPFWAWRW